MNKNIGWQLTESSTMGNIFIDGSTEIFKSGKWAFFAREMIQNSNDSLDENEDKLRIDISLKDIPSSMFPDKENILKHINGTLSITNLPERCKEFSLNAKKILESDYIRILKVSDYNTTGIEGSEKESSNVESNWNALVYDEGNSQKKDENSTGSYGTGKNAPFALSSLNTVFYVTKDKNNIYALEGVSKLFTSYIDDKKIDRKIYFAKTNESGKLRPLDLADCKENLNDLFIREEKGSDVIIFGVDFEENKMKKEIIQSVVENFFVLIEDDKLEVSVFDEKIHKDNLWSIIDKYCDDSIVYTNSNIKYGYIRQYLSVYSNKYEVKEFNENVTGAGNLRLLIAKGNDISGKWVAIFRNKGMKIFDSNIRTAEQNYSAIFFPGDKEVDKFLQEIENPTHNFFDPEIRINDKKRRELAIKRYRQIQNWIRQKIEEYTKISVSENDFLEGMEEYIQLDDSELESKVTQMPEIDIINYENKSNKSNVMVQSNTKIGKSDISEFISSDNKSNTKNDFRVETSDELGEERRGLVKDYAYEFKIKPKILSNGLETRIILSLENFDCETFNMQIESVGEDNTSSVDIPKIVKATDLNSGMNLKIVENEIVEIPNNDTNLINIMFERSFNSRLKINIYRMKEEIYEG